MAETIFIIDDEETLRENLREFFTRYGFHVQTARQGHEAIRLIDQALFDLVISDIRLPDMNGLDLLKRITVERPEVPVILMTAYASLDTAIQALREGAADYLIKPIQFEELLVKVRRLLRYSDLVLENQVLRHELENRYGGHTIIGQSPPIKAMFEAIRRIAPTKSTVLIAGESGTGKELVARAIHHASDRHSGRFVPINCGAIPETLLESELFGYKKGAFTGALRDKEGLFTTADRGTLFLDEISNLPLALQAKLLRVIEDGQVTPIGQIEPRLVDARVVCATNQNLRDAIEQGRFREDLYFRLNVVEVVIPPLRERREDIPLLVEHFLNKFNAEMKRNVKGITPEAMADLLDSPWKGNVRELENTIERAMIYCNGPLIERVHLVNCLDIPSPRPTIEAPDNLQRALQLYERTHIQRVLSDVRGDKRETAVRLGIGLSSLYRKLDQR